MKVAIARGIVSGIPEVLRLAETAHSAYLSVMSEAQPAVAEIAALVRGNVRAKWEGHEINTARFVKPKRTMHMIGG